MKALMKIKGTTKAVIKKVDGATVRVISGFIPFTNWQNLSNKKISFGQKNLQSKTTIFTQFSYYFLFFTFLPAQKKICLLDFFDQLGGGDGAIRS